jgi:lipase ATG15
MFVLMAGITGLRYYVNAAVVLEETGRMDLVDGVDEYTRWQKQSRLNEIVGNITRGRSLGVWMSVLGFLGFIFLALMLLAVGTEKATQATELPKVFLDDFEYLQQDSLRYPTCQLSTGLVDESPLTRMVDYAFLAGLAYRGTEYTQNDLDGWFGGEQAKDNEDVVHEYRTKFVTSSAVSFKLVTFPNSNNWAYILIRGTTNPWDMLTDAQLWSAAALMQVHRQLLPFGVMWTPIIKQLIRAITAIESSSIEAVSFYKDTTKFTKWVQAQSKFGGVGLTGHSLGGGLSIITGAQTGVSAVALSGPNAMLSRKSFDPPILREALDSKTFNIIPERDLVPMIDDVAQNWQSIRCEAEFANVIGKSTDC